MRRVMLALVAVVCASIGAAACQRDDAAKSAADPQKQDLRIASFSPAITATVIALGWEKSVVGRTPWCKSTAPIVGSLNDVDLETLAKMKPTLILIQQTRSGAPAQLEQVAREKGWRLEFIPATSLDDIRRMPESVVKAVGRSSPVDPHTLESALAHELEPCSAAGQLSPALLLYSDDPIAVFGEDTYLAQAWVQMGGSLAFRSNGNPNLSLEELFATRPKSIIVVVGSDSAMGPSHFALNDGCSKRVINLIHVHAPQLLRPGPELTEGLKLLRAAVQERAPRPDTWPAGSNP